ncbi:MAG: DUF3368 domain-containing protein [Gemmataceae bacterium]|nr:DUF3368 domain-containing protein [Gemmataceae bacterium]
MIIVADSSPLIVLVTTGDVKLIPALFRNVVVPVAVGDEVRSLKRPAAVREFIASPSAWLEIRSPTEIPPIEGLDAGEMAAIALAVELQADRLIIDEIAGRKAATERGLRVVGTVGILEAAAERGLVELEAAFGRLRQTDFWVSARFLDQRLAAFRQRQSQGGK